MSWLLAFVGFALLILLHELGHFVAAKWVGMRVEKFSLFFGKPIWKIQRGETQYQLSWLPLGGYVKITGMNPEEELPPEIKARSYSGSPVWKRIFVISAGPFVNFVIAFVLLAGVFLVEGKPDQTSVAVGKVEPAFAAAGKLEDGDRIVTVTVPADADADAGADGASASVARTFPGDAPNLTERERDARIKALTGYVATGGCGAKPLGPVNAQTGPQTARCDSAPPVFQVTVLREGKLLTLPITPKYDEELKRYRLGIAFGPGFEDVGVGGAASESVAGMWRVSEATIEAMSKVIYDPETRKQINSFVGGYETTRQSFEVDTAQALTVLALISLSLAIINLFPFLPLDGGHIFWALVEKARGGRPVATATLEKASIIGLVLVGMLFIIGITNDVNRIIDGTGFGVR